MMGKVVPETCWAYKKHNKTTSGISLVFYPIVSGADACYLSDMS